MSEQQTILQQVARLVNGAEHYMLPMPQAKTTASWGCQMLQLAKARHAKEYLQSAGNLVAKHWPSPTIPYPGHD